MGWYLSTLCRLTFWPDVPNGPILSYPALESKLIDAARLWSHWASSNSLLSPASPESTAVQVRVGHHMNYLKSVLLF